MVTCTRVKCVCAAWNWKIWMCALKIHLRVLKNHGAQLQKFSRTNGISSWPKNTPIWFKTAQPKKKKKKKKVARKDFLHLTPSNWLSSRNTGQASKDPCEDPHCVWGDFTTRIYDSRQQKNITHTSHILRPTKLGPRTTCDVGQLYGYVPVFWLLVGIYSVSNTEYSFAQRFFRCADWNPMGNFFLFLSQQLITFVHENYCDCAGWRFVRLQNGVVHTWTLKCWKETLAMPRKCHQNNINRLYLEQNVTKGPLWVFQARIQNFQSEAAQMHFRRAQMNMTRPISRCQHTHYAPKVARVIKARG